MTEDYQLKQHKPPLFEVYMPIEERKPRLPKRFSWPVGVERLSERFASVPQARHSRIWFGDHPFDSTAANPRLTMEHIGKSTRPLRIIDPVDMDMNGCPC